MNAVCIQTGAFEGDVHNLIAMLQQLVDACNKLRPTMKTLPRVCQLGGILTAREAVVRTEFKFRYFNRTNVARTGISSRYNYRVLADENAKQRPPPQHLLDSFAKTIATNTRGGFA